MLNDWPILTLVTFMPLLGVAFLLMIRSDGAVADNNAKFVALWTSGFTFMISLVLLFGFDNSASGYQFEEFATWIKGTNINYHMGVDGISMPFVLLSTFLTPFAILASW